MMKKYLRKKTIEVRLPIEYNPIFYRNGNVSPCKVLKCFSRKEMMDFVLLLSNHYVNQPAIQILNLMSHDNWWRKYTFCKLTDYLGRHQSNNRQFFVCFPQTVLEILRYGLAKQPSNHSMNEYCKYTLEFNVAKLIALLNSQTMKFKVLNSNSLEQLMMTSIGYNKEIQLYDFYEQFKVQFNLAIKFFTFLANSVKYQGLYKAFLNYFNITDWRDYVFTILSGAIHGRNNSGVLDLSIGIDPDNLINKSVLDKISINLDSDVLPYKSTNEYDMSGNSDYRYFRDKPFVKIEDNKYAIFHVGFVLDRLYGSLYFDLKKIVDNEKIKGIDLVQLFTSEFIEKIVFDGLMKESTLSSCYLSYSEDDCISQFNPRKGLGAPDYLLQDKKNNSVILFECKDIKINGWIKEQRNYSLLEAELKNKVHLTTWELDYNNKKHKSKKNPKVKGIGQLAGHCANIKKNKFKWGENVSSDSKVYSVLVIADNRLIIDGFTNKANEWYFESLSMEEVHIDSTIRPLIIMSPLCLLKYSKLFETNGFERYFEEYYRYINIIVQNPYDLIKSCISFDDFMKKYPYKLEDKFESLKKELMKFKKSN